MPPTILVVDPITTNRIVLRVKLSSAFFNVLQTGSGHDAVKIVASQSPDAVIIGGRLPDMDLADLCRNVATAARLRAPPILQLLPTPNRADLLAGLDAGVDEVLSQPLTDQLLLARIRALLRDKTPLLPDQTCLPSGFNERPAPFARQLRVALIGETTVQSQEWRHHLKPVFSGKILTAHGDTLEDNQDVDVVGLGLRSWSIDNGLSVLAKLRSGPQTSALRVLAIVDSSAGYLAPDALDMGANDVMLAGFDAQEAALRLQKLAPLPRSRATDPPDRMVPLRSPAA